MLITRAGIISWLAMIIDRRGEGRGAMDLVGKAGLKQLLLRCVNTFSLCVYTPLRFAKMLLSWYWLTSDPGSGIHVPRTLCANGYVMACYCCLSKPRTNFNRTAVALIRCAMQLVPKHGRRATSRKPRIGSAALKQQFRV